MFNYIKQKLDADNLCFWLQFRERKTLPEVQEAGLNYFSVNGCDEKGQRALNALEVLLMDPARGLSSSEDLLAKAISVILSKN